jgi:hypothetical protein
MGAGVPSAFGTTDQLADLASAVSSEYWILLSSPMMTVALLDPGPGSNLDFAVFSFHVPTAIFLEAVCEMSAAGISSANKMRDVRLDKGALRQV